MCMFVFPRTLPPASIPRLHMPLGASAVVFAVPCPLDGHRPDVSAVPGGIVRMDVSRCTPRRFHILLPFDQVQPDGVILSYFLTVIAAAAGPSQTKGPVEKRAGASSNALAVGITLRFSKLPPTAFMFRYFSSYFFTRQMVVPSPK